MNSTEKIVVANTNEDWWSLNECFFLSVSNETYEKMSNNYQSKWWRYFDGDYEGIKESDILFEANAQNFLLFLDKKVKSLIEENDSLKKQIEELSPND